MTPFNAPSALILRHSEDDVPGVVYTCNNDNKDNDNNENYASTIYTNDDDGVLKNNTSTSSARKIRSVQLSNNAFRSYIKMEAIIINRQHHS
jgi:hypothetical protein